MGLTNADNTFASLIASMGENMFVWHLGDQSYADDRVESAYEVLDPTSFSSFEMEKSLYISLLFLCMCRVYACAVYVESIHEPVATLGQPKTIHDHAW